MYTHAERTVKKYTVADAVEAAKARTTGPICTNALQRRAMDERITLEQLNELADAIVADTNTWG